MWEEEKKRKRRHYFNNAQTSHLQGLMCDKGDSQEQGWTWGPQNKDDIVAGSREKEGNAMTFLFAHEAGGSKVSSC